MSEEAIKLLHGVGMHDAAAVLETQRSPEMQSRIRHNGAAPIVAMDKGSDMGDAMAVSFLVGSGRAPGDTPIRMFLRDVERELSRARDKFPSSEGCMTALTEEVGELAKAMLDEPGERIYKEAVQTAVMAARVALEGDRSLENYRINRHGVDVGRARGVRP